MTDLSQSLEQLSNAHVDDSEGAETGLIESVIRAWKKPLNKLSNEEIGRLVVQQDGLPYILDLIWPKLEADPLFDGGYYPGDVLSNLIRADPAIWRERPRYREQLRLLYQRALDASSERNDAFRESLDWPNSEAPLH